MIPQASLTRLDYGAIIAYLGVLVVLGLSLRRFAARGLSNFFLGGRRLPGWLNGVSNAVTCMNADVAPAYCGMTVISGLYICWWYFSRFGLSLMVAAVLFAACWHRLRVSTSPEFYEVRFSGTPAALIRVLVAVRVSLFGVVIWIGAGLLGLCKITEGLLGWQKWETLLAVVPVIMVYVFLSGYLGVVLSDLLQTLIMIVSSLILLSYVWADFGGPAGLREALLDRFGQNVISWHPPSGHEFLGAVAILAWLIGSTVGYGGDLSTESQRVISCSRPKEAAKMYVWTQGVLFLMLAVLTLPALGAMARWPGLHNGEINKELSYGMLLGAYLPPGLLGLALVALFASIMSTIDSHMNLAGQVFVNDIYRRAIHRTASERQCLLAGKIVMCAVMGLSILVATVFTNVIDISIFMLGLTAAEMSANWGQWWWWRFNGTARLTALLGGPVVFVFAKYVIFGRWIDAGAATDYVIVLSAMTLTFILWVTVSCLTAPEPTEVLLSFYRRARPFGRWAPISARAGVPPRGTAALLRGLLVALTGMVAGAACIIALSGLYVGSWAMSLFAACIGVTAAAVFAIGFGRSVIAAPRKANTPPAN